MKTLTVIALTLFAAATAVENFGGKAHNYLVGEPQVETIELVYTTFTNKAPF